MMDDRIREILVITQEESAEVIQEISKIFRFGIESHHRDGGTHRERLTSEVGDLSAMIDLLISRGIVDQAAVDEARLAKISKLRQYSNIYS